MDTDHLAAALRDCAAGLYPLEAGTGLLISNASFLHREDFTRRFIEHGTSGGTPMAAIDWDAAITALASGDLPCSGGERRILQLSASLAGCIPVNLRDTDGGLDNANTARLITAIRHATGMRPGQSAQVTPGRADSGYDRAEASAVRAEAGVPLPTAPSPPRRSPRISDG